MCVARWTDSSELNGRRDPIPSSRRLKPRVVKRMVCLDGRYFLTYRRSDRLFHGYSPYRDPIRTKVPVSVTRDYIRFFSVFVKHPSILTGKMKSEVRLYSRTHSIVFIYCLYDLERSNYLCYKFIRFGT